MVVRIMDGAKPQPPQPFKPAGCLEWGHAEWVMQPLSIGLEMVRVGWPRVIAKVVPARPAPRPDFLARAKAIWGEQPPGKPLSELVLEARGGQP